MPETINGTVFYSADESKANHCPRCGSDDLDYGCLEVLDDCVEYPWTCGNCGCEGYEYANLVFDGHKVAEKE